MKRNSSTTITLFLIITILGTLSFFIAKKLQEERIISNTQAKIEQPVEVKRDYKKEVEINSSPESQTAPTPIQLALNILSPAPTTGQTSSLDIIKKLAYNNPSPFPSPQQLSPSLTPTLAKTKITPTVKVKLSPTTAKKPTVKNLKISASPTIVSKLPETGLFKMPFFIFIGSLLLLIFAFAL